MFSIPNQPSPVTTNLTSHFLTENSNITNKNTLCIWLFYIHTKYQQYNCNTKDYFLRALMEGPEMVAGQRCSLLAQNMFTW